MPVASTQERMQLGVPLGIAAEFQAQVGDRVFFSEGSAELGSRARTALEAQAAWLKRNAAVPVTIEGHADDAGAINHNLEVSRRRAESVRRRLIESGVAPERIHTLAYGRERPLRVGMTLSADVEVERRSLLSWFLSPLVTLKGRFG